MLIYHFKDSMIGECWMARKSVKNRRFSVFRVEKEVYEILTIDGYHYWNVDGLFIKDPKYFLSLKYHKTDIKYKETTFYRVNEIYDQFIYIRTFSKHSDLIWSGKSIHNYSYGNIIFAKFSRHKIC